MALAPKRKSPPTALTNPNPNKRYRKNENEHEISVPYANYFPDLIVHLILALLPSKLAAQAGTVSKQWADQWATISVLDLDEGCGSEPEPRVSDSDSNDPVLARHEKFVAFLRGYLNRRRPRPDPLEKLRVRMTYWPEDDDLIGEWLRFAVERKVKELSISLRGLQHESQMEYRLPRTTFLNAKFLTSLNLDFMKVNLNPDQPENEAMSFPSLKTMSFEWVDFDGHSLFYLISSCPSLERLSFDSCHVGSVIDDTLVETLIESPTLKRCELLHCICVHLHLNAPSLESFTFASVFGSFDNQSVTLADCESLKYVEISSEFLSHLRLYNVCQSFVQGTIDAPNLLSFDFGGYLCTNAYLIQSPLENLVEAGVYLGDERLGPVFNWPSDYFRNLSYFLANLSCCEHLTLYSHDQEGCLFPEYFREVNSTPLPNLKNLEILLSCTDQDRERDLRESLRWLAPLVPNPSIRVVETELI